MSSVLSRALGKRRTHARRNRSRSATGLWLKRLQSAEREREEARRVKGFVKWCRSVGIELHRHVSIQREGSCDALGVIAKGNISKGECVAVIPRSALLSCENSPIRDTVLEYQKLNGEDVSSWVPLLLALAAEYSSGVSSKWFPYLSVVPSGPSVLPMLWLESVRQPLLQGSGVDGWINADLQNIRRDYLSLVDPFIEHHAESLRVSMPDYDTYKQMVAYVMSYSFTDEGAGFLGQTMMVPFVDLLNHSSRHHVELTFHPKFLKLVAVRDISEGEEIMNTYGQLSNAELLHKYGFTELDNPNDEALISCDIIQEVYMQQCSDPNHWDTVVSLGVAEDEYAVDIEGEVESGLLLLVRLLHSKYKTAKSLKKKCLPPDSLDDCCSEEVAFLTRVAEHCLAGYPEQLSESERRLPSIKRERDCWHVVLGQQNSLRKFITQCQMKSH